MEVREVMCNRLFALEISRLAFLSCKFLNLNFIAAISAVADSKAKLLASNLLNFNDLICLVLALYKPTVFFEARDIYIGNLTAFSADNCLNAGKLFLGVLILDLDGFSSLMLTLRCRLLRSRKDSGSRQ